MNNKSETPTSPGRPLTIAEKIWDSHVVSRVEGEPDLLYIDLHLTHEATSAQAFEGLREASRPVRRPDLTLAVEDHNVPTDSLVISDPVSLAQIDALRRNCSEHGIELYRLGSAEQGIVHVIGPENGLVHPGMTVACGDSHSSTHGALGALGFGVGTSQVEHVLATQVLPLRAWRPMRVSFEGQLPDGVTAKDLMLALISRIGTNSGRGYVIEFAGSVVEKLSMESRMTMCNMTIEAGARAGLVAPDQVTLDYLRGRRYAPGADDWPDATSYWLSLRTDADARFDREVVVDASDLSPFVTWGTNPSQAVPLSDPVPDPRASSDPASRVAAERALEYMGIAPGQSLSGLPVDAVFVGSCTNGRIEDLRSVAKLLRDRKVAPGVTMLIVPGSMRVRAQAEAEGLAAIFTEAGAQWRTAGCSMCLAMNPDRLTAGMRCASTSNRNFEGRQGPGVRTHLVSPEVAAATAIAGRLTAPSGI